MYRIWRRWLSLLTALALALVFCFAACPFAAFADDTGQKVYQDMIYYTITPMHEVTITGARAILTEANIPAELDGCPVTEIERYAFKDCTRLKQVILPDTIRRIGEFAFKDCTRLERISIPDTVSDIGWGIVQGTPWLDNQTEEFVVAGSGFLLAYTGADATVTIPDTVSTIGGYAFEGCTTLENVVMPDSVQTIDAFAFLNCSRLHQVQFPAHLKTIGEYAFHWCTALEEVQIPDTVTTVGNHGFSYCRSLKSISLPAGLTQISNTLFQGCTSLEELQIPDGVQVIYNYAFDGCSQLQKITLPESVEEIGSNAFSGCTALKRLVILNLACRIYDAEKTVEPSVRINGYAASTAQIYAQKYRRTFHALDRKRGDMNGDDVVDTSDQFDLMYLCARRGAGIPVDITAAQTYCADYNQDGVIDTTDIFELMYYLAMRGAGVLVEDPENDEDD